MTINEKIKNLREQMKKHNIDTYLITKLDPHNSEISHEYFNGVLYMSGFTGSNGTIVITQEEACLWTDGRYFLQAEKELKNSEFILQKIDVAGYPTYIDYIKDKTKKGGALGFDGTSLTVTMFSDLSYNLKNKNISFFCEQSLLDIIWENRPKLSDFKIIDHLIKYAGKSRTDKIKEVQNFMEADGVDYYLISSLDSIAWLFNLRGKDVASEPTFLSYALIEKNSATLFVDSEKISDVSDILKNDNVKVKNYNDIFDNLKNSDNNKIIAINPNYTNYLISEVIKNLNIFNLKTDYTATLKSQKNETEIENIKNVNIRDSVLLLKAVKWIKENAGKVEFDECDVAKLVTKQRAKDENYFSNSFEPIVGFGDNGAIIHYRPQKDDCKKIENNNFLLIDSGGQYYDGTTDVTRTLVLGEITDEMKKHFTYVLKSNIALTKAVFIAGTTGLQIEYAARKIMWDNHMHYRTGTGHGIGFFLNVHEGPHSISPRFIDTPLKEGMLLSNEPGVYRDGKYGIRTETNILVKKSVSNEYGDFLEFETVSFFPIDVNGIDVSLLTDEELLWINNYHEEVFKKLSPFLDDEERTFLKEETKKLLK